MLVPAPWREAFGQAKPFKIGTLQPLSGTAAAGGKTALVGVQMAVDRINKSGGINGRPLELLIADYESKPDVGRRKAEKLVVDDQIDAHAGGYLSNVCLACMPVYEENKVVNMITVCLDTTITTTKCSRYTFRPFDYAPAQAVAAAPYLVNKIGKRWHIAYADYAWGQSTRDAYVEQIKGAGGSVVETTGIPLGTADMTPFLSKVTGSFDGLFGIFFGPQGISFLTHRPLHPRAGGRPEYASPQEVRRRRGGAPQADRPERPAARPLRAVQLRGRQHAQDRHAEVGLPGTQGHDEAHRGSGRARDEGRRRLPAGRQGSPEGGPPGIPTGVPVRAPRGEIQDPGRHSQGKDDLPVRLQVRIAQVL
jgi:hypothetical protein